MATADQPTHKADVALLGRRAAARFIDGWLVGFALIAFWGFGFILVAGDCPTDNPACYPEGFVAAVILVLAGSALFLGTVSPILYDFVGVARWEKTVGKSALGLRVIRLDGAHPRWWQCLVRAATFWLFLPVPAVAIYAVLTSPVSSDRWESLTLILSLICITGAATFALLQRRFLHDWVARTQVVRVGADGDPVDNASFLTSASEE